MHTVHVCWNVTLWHFTLHACAHTHTHTHTHAVILGWCLFVFPWAGSIDQREISLIGPELRGKEKEWSKGEGHTGKGDWKRQEHKGGEDVRRQADVWLCDGSGHVYNNGMHTWGNRGWGGVGVGWGGGVKTTTVIQNTNVEGKVESQK